MAYDADAAGQKAIDKGVEVLESIAGGSPLRLQVLSIPDDEDPDTFLRKFGAPAFEKLLGTARPYTAYYLDKLLDRHDLANPVDKVWLENLMAYTGTGVNGISFTYWSWNPNSGDTGGIVGDDWTTVNQAKQSILQPYLIPPVGGGPGPTTTTTPGGSGGCKTAWKLDNSWQGGFQGSLTVTNTGTNAATPWTVTFTLPGATVSNGWNGTFTQSGSTVTVTAPSHSPTLAPGASVSLGFTANGPTTAPSAVTLNQSACT